ncbi:MAG: helix-turn-helix domain-containing protein [Tepidiformaceae bacterium]
MATSAPSMFQEAALYEAELTSRQREVLNLLARGMTNAQIGERLGISADGAKWHVSEILTKLALSSREEAAAYWIYRNSFQVRFRRIAGGFFGLQTLKWAGIGAGAAAIGAIAIIAVVAAMGGSEDEPTPGDPDDPTPSPTVETLPCPVDQAACDFAREIDRWLETGDSAALAAASVPIAYTCPDPDAQGAGRNLPLCEGGAQGELRDGFRVSVAASDQMEVFTAADWEDALNDFLAGVLPANVTLADAPRVSGIICPDFAPDCSGDFVIVTNLTAAGTGQGGQPFHQGVALYVETPGGTRGLTGLTYNAVGFEAAEPIADGAAVPSLLFPGGTAPVNGAFFSLPTQ